MKIVVALDGHLLLPPDAKSGISGQKEAAVRIASILGEMAKAGHKLGSRVIVRLALLRVHRDFKAQLRQPLAR